ncbi:MAG: hypothetical protein RJA22_345 [Verrucomicrobiota bacterium]
MTVVDTRRLRRLAGQNPLAAALVLSVVIHLSIFGFYRVGKKLGWLDQHPTWLTRLTQKILAAKPRSLPLVVKPPAPAAPKPREIPLTFVEVDPATVTPDAPQDAKYYSSQNTRASNPDATKATDTPKMDGKQTQVVRVMENERPLPFPLQPSAPPTPAPRPEDPLLPKPKGDDAAKPGDLASLKTGDPRPKSETTVDSAAGTALIKTTDRPRTLAAARQQAMLAGQPLKQEGGTQRRGRLALDTKATPFGTYDANFIAAVQARWYQILDQQSFTQRHGSVTIEFKLHHDGRISELVITRNEVGDILGMFCWNAIEEPAPYAKWPDDMRRAIGANTREIRFTFYYY